MESKPTVGIIGKGHAGSALATGLRKAGYPVETTGRDPGRIEEIARTANIVILAVPPEERKEALKRMGAAVRGKTVVDVTNNLTKDAQYAGDLRTSLAEDTQRHAKEAHAVKAFNTIFAENLATGRVNGEPLTLFVAGDDADAKQMTRSMGEAIGFEVIDAGPLAASRWLEAVGYFQIHLGLTQHLGTNIGLRVSGVGAGDGHDPRPSGTPSVPGLPAREP